MRRSAHRIQFSIILLVIVALAACGRTGGASPAVTVENATEAARADALATATTPFATPGLPRTRTPDIASPTPAPEHCTNPHLTPIPVTGTPSPAPTPAADATEATPTPVRIPHADEVPTVEAKERQPLVEDEELERRIRERLGDAAEHYAIVIKDLRDGRGVAIEPERVLYAASLFKLEVMYEIFHQRDAGLLRFDERYVATDYYSGFDLGPHVLGQCSTVSIRDALAAMMSVSDNVAAVMLLDRAGARHINDAMAALGLEDTALTEDQSLPATAGDVARLVEAIARGEGLTGLSVAEMTALMRAEEQADRIPRWLPDETVIAHKAGNWTDATHDAGIVYGRRSAYVMVLMSDLGFESDASLVEADVAKIAWDHFEGPP